MQCRYNNLLFIWIIGLFLPVITFAQIPFQFVGDLNAWHNPNLPPSTADDIIQGQHRYAKWTVQATQQGQGFLVQAGLNKWTKNNVPFGQVVALQWCSTQQCSNGSFQSQITPGNHYTVRIRRTDKDKVGDFYENRLFSVQELQVSPAQILSVEAYGSLTGTKIQGNTRLNNPTQGLIADERVLVFVSLSKALAPSEYLYLRYITNTGQDYILSSYRQNADRSYEFELPSQLIGTQVNYYAFTTTIPFSVNSKLGVPTQQFASPQPLLTGEEVVDMLTLNFRNVDGENLENPNGNYFYQVTENPLPVVSVLSANQEDDGLMFSWTTSAEKLNMRFTIEQQDASNNPIALAQVDAIGSRVSTQAYRYHALDVAYGTQRFRLKVEDGAGNISYSEWLQIEVQVPEEIRITALQPNPATTEVQLSFSVREEQLMSVVAYNLLGQKVATLYEGTLQPNFELQTTWSLSGVPNGIYFIHISGAGVRKVQRLWVLK